MSSSRPLIFLCNYNIYSNKACLYLLSINKLTKYRTSSAYSTMLESGSPVPGHNLLYNS